MEQMKYAAVSPKRGMTKVIGILLVTTLILTILVQTVGWKQFNQAFVDLTVWFVTS